jgi:hypothetical protein
MLRPWVLACYWCGSGCNATGINTPALRSRRSACDDSSAALRTLRNQQCSQPVEKEWRHIISIISIFCYFTHPSPLHELSVSHLFYCAQPHIVTIPHISRERNDIFAEKSSCLGACSSSHDIVAQDVVFSVHHTTRQLIPNR